MQWNSHRWRPSQPLRATATPDAESRHALPRCGTTGSGAPILRSCSGSCRLRANAAQVMSIERHRVRCRKAVPDGHSQRFSNESFPPQAGSRGRTGGSAGGWRTPARTGLWQLTAIGIGGIIGAGIFSLAGAVAKDSAGPLRPGLPGADRDGALQRTRLGVGVRAGFR